MFINTLSIQNFRLFEELELEFKDRLSVVVGVNGAGKSTVLDAIGHLLNCYVGGFDGHSVGRIDRSDIRHVTYQIPLRRGSSYENVAQPPVMISAEGTISSREISWSVVKAKDSASSSSPSAYAEMTKLANEYQDRLRIGDYGLFLPLVAYYGTNRLWAQETSRHKLEKQLTTAFSRLDAYDDCLGAHITDTMLTTWFERMTYKSLQQQFEIPALKTVRRAVENGMKSFTDLSILSVEYDLDMHQLTVVYERDGTLLQIPSSQLSDGYRVALNLFADIAYRAAILNPQLEDNVLRETEGIVLIDEVDLHLHPKWQQIVLSDLMNTFPKMQFVVTTHAPAVISSVEDGQLIIVNGNDSYSTSEGFYGRDANAILRRIMGTPERPKRVKEMFDKFYNLIDSGNLDSAEELLRRLTELVGENDAELTSCSVRLDLERMEF